MTANMPRLCVKCGTRGDGGNCPNCGGLMIGTQSSTDLTRVIVEKDKTIKALIGIILTVHCRNTACRRCDAFEACDKDGIIKLITEGTKKKEG